MTEYAVGSKWQTRGGGTATVTNEWISEVQHSMHMFWAKHSDGHSHAHFRKTGRYAFPRLSGEDDPKDIVAAVL